MSRVEYRSVDARADDDLQAAISAYQAQREPLDESQVNEALSEPLVLSDGDSMPDEHGTRFCTFAFLVGQLWIAQQLSAAGYYADSSPAVAFLYLLSGAHGVHLVGGLVAWCRTALKIWRGQKLDQVFLSVELCAIYWHYLLGIWLVLFGLMVLT